MRIGSGWHLVMPQVFKTSCRTCFTPVVGSIPTHSRHRLASAALACAAAWLAVSAPAAARTETAGTVDSAGIIRPSPERLPLFKPKPHPPEPEIVPGLLPADAGGGAEDLAPRPMREVPDSLRKPVEPPGLQLHGALDSAVVFAVYEVPGLEDGRYAARAPSSGSTRKAAIAYPRPGPGWVMLRSVVVPGWGQWTNGRWWKGLLAAGLEGYLVAGALDAARDVRDTEAGMDSAALANASSRLCLGGGNQLACARDRKVKYIWWTIGAVGLSMLDAFVDAHFKDFDVTPIARIERAGAGTMLGVRLSWAGFSP